MKIALLFGLACENGHLEAAKLLYKHGGKIGKYKVGHTARNGHYDVVDFLLEQDTAKKQFYLDVALPLVVEGNNLEMAQYLLDLGADINAGDENALYTATFYIKQDMLLFCLEHGAKIDDRIMKVAQGNITRLAHCGDGAQKILELLEKWPERQRIKDIKSKRDGLHRRASSFKI